MALYLSMFLLLELNFVLENVLARYSNTHEYVHNFAPDLKLNR